MVIGMIIWTVVRFFFAIFAVPAAMLILHGTIRLLKRSILKDQTWIWMIALFISFISIILGSFLLIGIEAVVRSAYPFDWGLPSFVLSEIMSDSTVLNHNLGLGIVGMIVYSVFFLGNQIAKL